MRANDTWTVDEANERLRRLDDYKGTITRLLPGLPRHYVNGWSMLYIDALATACFLDRFPREISVLDIGTFLGVSAFHFAGHPKVIEVTSVDPNPKIADEINEKSPTGEIRISPELLQDRRVLDVARAALECYPVEHGKTRLLAGVVGVNKMGVHGGVVQGLKRVTIPDASGEASLVAFVDGLHTAEGVHADLKGVFGKDPNALAFLDDCQSRWAPAIKAGVAAFSEEAPKEYRFRLFKDLSPGLATSNLGIVYSETPADNVEGVLEDFGRPFDALRNLLRLMREEEKLTGVLNEHEQALQETRAQLAKVRSARDRRIEQNNALEEINTLLKKENAGLKTQSSRRRYRIADAVADRVLRLPYARELLTKLTR